LTALANLLADKRLCKFQNIRTEILQRHRVFAFAGQETG